MKKLVITSSLCPSVALVSLAIVSCVEAQTVTLPIGQHPQYSETAPISKPLQQPAPNEMTRSRSRRNILSAMDGVTALLLLAAVYLGFRLTALNLAVAHAEREYISAAKRIRELRARARSPAEWRNLAAASRLQLKELPQQATLRAVFAHLVRGNVHPMVIQTAAMSAVRGVFGELHRRLSAAEVRPPQYGVASGALTFAIALLHSANSESVMLHAGFAALITAIFVGLSLWAKRPLERLEVLMDDALFESIELGYEAAIALPPSAKRADATSPSQIWVPRPGESLSYELTTFDRLPRPGSHNGSGGCL